MSGTNFLPWHRGIAYMDVGTYVLSGTKNMTVHPEHRRSLPSMAPRHTVHPEHKKARCNITSGFHQI